MLAKVRVHLCIVSMKILKAVAQQHGRSYQGAELRARCRMLSTRISLSNSTAYMLLQWYVPWRYHPH
jgi:hypothetical protein